jgi:hypothetical protein
MENLNRQALYDLVWSKPMTHAAKELGVSDVMLGKMCAQQDIPRPSRGYWESLASGKNKHKYTKPPLPEKPADTATFNDFLLAEFDSMTNRQSPHFDWKDLDSALPDAPEELEESCAETALRLCQNMPDLPEFSSYQSLHRVAQRYRDLETENARIEGDLRSLRFLKTTEARRLLETLNGFAWSMDSLGMKVTLTGRKRLNTFFKFFGNDFEFSLYCRSVAADSGSNGATCATKMPCLRYSLEEYRWSATPKGGTREIQDFSAKDIRAILVTLLTAAEQKRRESIQDSYNYAVSARRRLIKEIEGKRLAAIESERERLRQLEAYRNHELSKASLRIAEAERIRNLVASLDSQLKTKGTEIDGFEDWKRWALHQANMIDPRCISAEHFEQWIGSFQLGHETK